MNGWYQIMFCVIIWEGREGDPLAGNWMCYSCTRELGTWPVQLAVLLKVCWSLAKKRWCHFLLTCFLHLCLVVYQNWLKKTVTLFKVSIWTYFNSHADSYGTQCIHMMNPSSYEPYYVLNQHSFALPLTLSYAASYLKWTFCFCGSHWQ